jgi:hypothetical protein
MLLLIDLIVIKNRYIKNKLINIIKLLNVFLNIFIFFLSGSILGIIIYNKYKKINNMGYKNRPQNLVMYPSMVPFKFQ